MPPEGRRYDADVDMSGRTIDDGDYRGAVFEGRADFARCVFTERADFTGAVFKGRIHFQGAVFEKGVSFQDAVFGRYVNFDGAQFRVDARFRGARIHDMDVGNVVVDGPLMFNWAIFENNSLLGPVRCEALDLRLAAFHRRVRIEVTASEVRCERSRFLGGVRLLVGGRSAEPPAAAAPAWPEPLYGPAIDMTDVELGAASLVGALRPDDRDRWPRIVALRGTDAALLTVSYVRLSECRLAGVHNLDKLAIEGYRAFEIAPPRPWITKRFITRDEHLLRALWRRTGRRHWALPGGPAEVPESASEVEQVYRALRRGLADAKDEIAAADFYYGEMEMRRYGQFLLARTRWKERWWTGWLATRGEHLLLWLYWAFSGYGLRAWRAFAALALVVTLAAAGFLAWGFRPGADMSYADSVRFSLRAATSILRGPELKLTAAGEWIELALRFTGPVLFGLAIFALRGRVKR